METKVSINKMFCEMCGNLIPEGYHPELTFQNHPQSDYVKFFGYWNGGNLCGASIGLLICRECLISIRKGKYRDK